MAPCSLIRKRSVFALTFLTSMAGLVHLAPEAAAQLQPIPVDPIPISKNSLTASPSTSMVKQIDVAVVANDYSLPATNTVPLAETVDNGASRYVAGVEHKLHQSTVEIGVGYTPGKSLTSLPAMPKGVSAKITTDQPKQGVAVVRLDGANKTTYEQALNALRADATVEYAYPVLVDATARTRVLVTNEMIVVPSSAKSPAELEADMASLGMSRVPEKDCKAGNYIVFEIDDPDTIDPFALESKLNTVYGIKTTATAGVESAEVNLFRQIQWQYSPNDPDFGDQWHLDNTGQSGLALPDADIDAPEAWDTTLGDSEVVIAIIDSGVEPDHPDLADNMWVNEAELTGTGGIDDDFNGYIDDIYGYDFYDDIGDPSPTGFEAHGMGCAGIAAAVIDNAIGRSGGANVSVMGLNIGTEFSDGSATFVDDITTAAIYNYAWMNGADILSNSYGVSPASATMNTAIDTVVTSGRGGLGSLFFASTGNSASHWTTAGINISGLPADTYWVTLFYAADVGAGAPAAELALDDVILEGSLSTLEPTLAGAGWFNLGFPFPAWLDYGDDAYATGGNGMQNPALAAGEICTLTFPAQVAIIDGGLTTVIRYRYKGPASPTTALQLQLDSTTTSDAFAVQIPGNALVGLTQNPTTAVGYPANYANAIAVGASSDNDYRSNYSQYGPEVAFVAPSNGGWLPTYSLDPTGAVGSDPGDYRTFGGTSSSAPQAAGVAALGLSFNPTVTHGELLSAMGMTCDQIGNIPYAKLVAPRNDQYGHGRLNAASLLAALNEGPTDIDIDNDTVSEDAPVGTVVGNLSATDPNDPETFTFDPITDPVPFEIVGTELRTTGLLDFDVDSFFDISFTVRDTANNPYTEVIRIYVDNVTENLTVTTLLDENDGGLGLGTGDSLRELIEAAGTGDTIDFDPGLTGGAVTKINQAAQSLLQDTLFIPVGITINGPGCENLELVADSTSLNYPFRIMLISEGLDVTIRGLGFRNGLAEGLFPDNGGGAILLLSFDIIPAFLTIENCCFYNNGAHGLNDFGFAEAFGGAVLFASYGELTITGSVFEGNYLETFAEGGQLPLAGEKQLGDSSQGGAGVYITAFGEGGPEPGKSIKRRWSSGKSKAKRTKQLFDPLALIDGCGFFGNIDYGPGTFFGSGAGLLAELGSVTIRNSEFFGNEEASIAGYGGAISSGADEMIIEDTLIHNNTTTFLGGAIENYFGPLSITRSSLHSNGGIGTITGPVEFGGGIYSSDSVQILNSTISSNTAIFDGGGLYLETILSQLEFSAVVRNEVLTPGPGGGIYHYTEGTGTLLLDSNIVAENINGLDPRDFSADCDNLVSLSSNVVGSNLGVEILLPEGAPNGFGDLVGGAIGGLVDPLIGPLADYGNGAMMHGLLLNSPARDFGNTTGPPVDDQRTAPRSYKQISVGLPDSGPYEVQDFDGDGILDDEENTVPSQGGSSLQPVTDGSGDGVVDSIQQTVGSLQSANPASDYMTVVVDQPLYLTNVYDINDPVPGILDPLDFEYRFVGFDVNGLEVPGDQVVVQILYETPLVSTRYYKVGPTSIGGSAVLYPFMATGPTFPDNLGATFISPTEVLLTLVDGARGDSDLTANQVIQDPGGPGVSEPLFVELASFEAVADDFDQPVAVRWSTAAEIDNVGFNVYRGIPVGDGKFQIGEKLNGSLIPSEATATSGADYELIDADPITVSEERWYWLEDIDVSSRQALHGPVKATVGKETRVEDWMMF